METRRDIPSWLTEPQDYHPGSDRDGFVSKSLLSVTSMLARFRLDDGKASPLSPTPALKLALGLVSTLLVSLSRNFFFVAVVFATLLVRTCLLPQRALGRVCAGAGAACLFTLVVMAPAALIGQPQAALTLAGKALVSTGIALTVALTTPQAQLTGALRAYHVPSLAILTIDLALRSIVRLGEVASEALTALSLRSVGKNRSKQASLGGVGGIVLLKAGKAARDTHDAMRCRGFDGSYHVAQRTSLRPLDLVWIAALGALVALFVYCQGAL